MVDGVGWGCDFVRVFLWCDVLSGSRSPLSGPPVRLESPHRWEVSYSEDEDFLMGLPDGDPSSGSLAYTALVAIGGRDTGPSLDTRDRIAVWDDALRSRGYDANSRSLITSCHKESTRNQYQSGWKYWLEFKLLRNILDSDVSVSSVCNFLGYHFFDKGRALNTIKNYFYALRDPFEALYGLEIGNTKEIGKLFAGAFQRRPPRKGKDLMPKWSLSELLEYLSGPPFELLEAASWDDILAKTVILAQLASGRRIGELAFTVYRCPSAGNDSVVSLLWADEFIAKAERVFDGWVPRAPEIRAISLADRTLCPVRAFHEYYARRTAMGPGMYDGRLWPLGKVRLSYLVVRTIQKSIRQAHPTDMAMVRVGTHHVRKLAISLSWKYFMSSQKSLYEKVGSRGMATLFSTYIRDVPPVTLPCVVPLGTLTPDMPAVRDLSDI